MSIVKTAMAGVTGFVIGAGMMLMPGNQKLKKQMMKQTELLKKMVKQW